MGPPLRERLYRVIDALDEVPPRPADDSADRNQLVVDPADGVIRHLGARNEAHCA